MATVIRLRRGGRTHKPYYRIVVQDSRVRGRGPELDSIGIYHPAARPEPVSEVDVIKALDWLRKGAKASDTVMTVFKKSGVIKHFVEGTTPEEAVAVTKQAPVEDKGYNAPPPPKEETAEEPVSAETAEEPTSAEAAAEPASEETPASAE